MKIWQGFCKRGFRKILPILPDYPPPCGSLCDVVLPGVRPQEGEERLGGGGLAGDRRPVQRGLRRLRGRSQGLAAKNSFSFFPCAFDRVLPENTRR